MTASIDLYWSFRSPYSYLVTGRMVALGRHPDIEVRVRIVQPLAIRDPSFFERVDPLFLRYLMGDLRRVGEMLDIPIRFPRPDPVVMDNETREISPDQPYIHRLSRLGVAAAEAGRGLAFIDEVSRLIWDGRTENWHEGDHLAGAAERAGLDLAALDKVIEADPQHYVDALAANMEALTAAGHWGVPTMVFNGEPFFGQDRFDVLVWRLEQNDIRLSQPDV